MNVSSEARPEKGMSAATAAISSSQRTTHPAVAGARSAGETPLEITPTRHHRSLDRQMVARLDAVEPGTHVAGVPNLDCFGRVTGGYEVHDAHDRDSLHRRLARLAQVGPKIYSDLAGGPTDQHKTSYTHLTRAHTHAHVNFLKRPISVGTVGPHATNTEKPIFRPVKTGSDALDRLGLSLWLSAFLAGVK